MAALISVLCSWFVKQIKPVRNPKYNIPVPEVCHIVIPLEKDAEKDVFVVGDVHGCYDELKTLLEKANVLKNTNAIVIFVGDLINKGPKNVEVLQLFKDLGDRGFSVRGNNEEATLRQLFILKNDPSYDLPVRYQWMTDIKEDVMDLFINMPYTIEIPSLNAIIVHAGLVPGKSLEKQSLYEMTHMRNLVDEDAFLGNGLYGTGKTSKGVAWATLWSGPEHVYFGHDARRRLQILPFATGLDTASVYGAQLTGIFLTGKRNIISVESKYDYNAISSESDFE